MASTENGRVAVRLPLSPLEGPKWLEEIILTREGDDIIFELMRTNGTIVSCVHITAERFNHIADILLSEGS